jgi:hypothetical protein
VRWAWFSERSGSATLVSNIIAPLHFADDPMQQARIAQAPAQ